ncbi:MAG: hypothetical protein MH825_08145 [Cyanobacteria bacterium]|nr:hypothetical protein [Cyanobacteriota bacterium]
MLNAKEDDDGKVSILGDPVLAQAHDEFVPPTPKAYGNRIDFQLLRSLGNDDEQSFNPELPLHVNLENALGRCVTIHEPARQLPIIKAFLLLPSALINIAPIGIALGPSGSGKSTLCKVAAELHRVQILAASSTYAAVRNQVNTSRWFDEECVYERHTMLVFDDLKEHAFNPDLFTLFRCGYDRATETIAIATEGGKNLEFKSFCPKLFSTVSQFPFDSKYEELLRRSLVFFFQKDESQREYDDPSDIGWNEYSEAFRKKWEDNQNCLQFIELLKGFKSKPKGLNHSQWKISRPLVASLIANEIAPNYLTAIGLIKEYWAGMVPPKSPLFQILVDVIASQRTAWEQNLEHGYVGPFEISPKLVKDAVALAESLGQLDRRIQPHEIRDEMAALGWTLKKGDGGEIKWLND